MKIKIFFTGIVLLAAIIVSAQEQKQNNSELFKEVAALDSAVFGAFNARDIDRFKQYFTDDLEFYHDRGGLTGYDHTIKFLETTTQSKSDLRRELVKESLEVYPIPGYGAMQIGAHRFCHMENNQEECGTFRFVHIWQKKDGKWKITRVVSYGH
jgi:ketosteroid isomerase-like protein